MTEQWVAGFVAFCLIGIGVGALVAPLAASRQFGIGAESAAERAFIRAMGVRDLVLGVLLLLLAASERRELIAWALIASAAVALVDLAVTSAAGARLPARLLHGVGGLGLIVAGVALL
jgi:hypothetical protein